MKTRCVIVEDEPLARERTRDYIGKLPFLELVAEFDEALSAAGFLKSNAVDLMFLDVNLGDFSGIQLLETIKPDCQVILTTAYTEYALKGYELKVSDYLLKPFRFERFVQAVGRAQELMQIAGNQDAPSFIFVKTEYRLEKIDLDELLYIEGMDDYRRIHTRSKKVMTLQTFAEFERLVPAHRLCRVHKSWMVAPNKIEAIERDRIRIGEVLIPISERYKAGFMAMVNGQGRG